jgi:RHS repeat-associated protein
VWRNAITGENYLWPMDGTTIKATEGYFRTIDLDWQIAAIRDYDGDGKADIFWRRGQDQLPSREYVYLGDIPVAVFLSGSPTPHYIHVDHLNTPRLVANAAQQTVWRWDHWEPFGATGPDENPSGLGVFELPLRFPGQYFDKETNLHYNYFRDYDPSLGRYGESDPIGLEGGLNTYSYVGGNPLIWTDPTGEAIPIVWGVAWAVVQIGGRIAISAAARNTARAGIAVAAGALSQTRSAEEDCDMFRAMIPDPDGFPLVAPTARGLGVRPGIDVPQTNPSAIVMPGPQGMSVSPSLATLPLFRRPPQFGGTGKDPVYCMCRSQLPPTLMYVPDPVNPGGHGFVSPALPTPLGAYQAGLGSTRNQWRVVR